jgi:hypothetical protein
MTVKEQRRIETATCFKQRRRKIKYKVILEFTVQRYHIVEAETPEEAEDLALYGEGYIDHDEDWSYNNYSDIEEIKND